MNSKGNVKFIIIIVIACLALLYFFKDNVVERVDKVITTEASVADNIRKHATYIIAGNKQLVGKVVIEEVQYSEDGKVAIIVVKNKGNVDKDAIKNAFDILEDLKRVDDVKVVIY